MTTDETVLEPLEPLVIQETTEAPETSTAEAEPTPDYKALHEQGQRDIAKLRNDLKALGTSRMRQEERDAKMDDVLARLAGIERRQDALIRSRATEDDELEKEAGRIQAETAQARSNRSLQSQYDTATSRFFGALNDDAGNPILAENAPELAGAYRTFNLGAETVGLTSEQRISYWNSAIDMAKRAALASERAALEKRHKAEIEAERKARKKALEDAGVFDLDAGPAAGGGATATNENIDLLWTQFDQQYPNRKNPYDKQYREALGLG